MVGDVLIIAYDAGCGPCTQFKSAVGLLDARGRIEFLSLEEAEESGALDSVDPSSRYRSFHLIVSGKASSGAEALLPLLEVLLPGGRLVSTILEAAPGFHTAISFGYSVLSRLHDTGSCSSNASTAAR